jgi:hypothetical protein
MGSAKKHDSYCRFTYFIKMTLMCLEAMGSSERLFHNYSSKAVSDEDKRP